MMFKSTAKFEKYFDVKNIKHLKFLTKPRLSGHKLMIEEGRRMRSEIPRNERICNTCNTIEDEIHSIDYYFIISPVLLVIFNMLFPYLL